jgi:hypothetical protein
MTPAFACVRARLRKSAISVWVKIWVALLRDEEWPAANGSRLSGSEKKRSPASIPMASAFICRSAQAVRRAGSSATEPTASYATWASAP